MAGFRSTVLLFVVALLLFMLSSLPLNLQTECSASISWLRGWEMFHMVSRHLHPPLQPHTHPLIYLSFSLMCSSISTSTNSTSINNQARLLFPFTSLTFYSSFFYFLPVHFLYYYSSMTLSVSIVYLLTLVSYSFFTNLILPFADYPWLYCFLACLLLFFPLP